MKDVRKELSRLNDRQLIAHFHRSRDERAFAELVSRHGPMVLRVCRRILRNEHDAEDVCQGVFLLLARKSGKVRWHACVANWLYGAAVRIAQQENRRMTKHRAQPLADMAEIGARADENWEEAEVERMLYEELHGLPAKYRASVVLCHLEGRTRQQAAEELGLNETTVKGRLERGRDMLRRRLSKRGVALPAALLSGELAAQIAEGAFSHSMTTLTAQAATKFAVGSSAAGASASAAVTIAKGELGKMLLAAQIKWAAVTVAVGVVGTGTILVSQNVGRGNATMNKATVAAAEESAAPTPQPVTPANEQLAFADEETPEQADEPESDAPSRGAISDALKTFGLAMHNYHADNNAFPPATNYDANQNKLLSWRVHILPYLNERELYNRFRLNEPWDSPHNKALIEQMPAIFAAESDALQKTGKTVFLVPVGEGTVFDGRDPVAFRDISDGTVNTILVLTVRPQYAVEWTRPEEWELNETKPFEKLSGQQGMAFQFLTCDGAAHHGSRAMTLAELKALLTRGGGEAVNF